MTGAGVGRFCNFATKRPFPELPSRKNFKNAKKAARKNPQKAKGRFQKSGAKTKKVLF